MPAQHSIFLFSVTWAVVTHNMSLNVQPFQTVEVLFVRCEKTSKYLFLRDISVFRLKSVVHTLIGRIVVNPESLNS